ncbi:PEP-CTERM sorting domain-containing protein [Geomonas subterranea]|uniref:PEP-CTERM sorting domain-containing protein n=2 Tax=Geomonas subterranea TaxID=2847989 RepID=A0ABX8LRW1_9BACT|nr:PEP-CTERM sorting domain-containing protein [Geomonas subterranea]QXM11584.1 PEP-CTERM sorting domain-containing protein [Geomonas subterranea]
MYYKFLLDINQKKNADRFLDLVDVKLFLLNSGNTNFSSVADLGTPLWSFDTNGGTPDVVHMDYSLNNGSGWGDIYMYIPTSVFDGQDGSKFFTLYSKFNLNNDGFEEWATMTSTSPPVPEPGTFLLLGMGFLGLAVASKRRRNNA